MTLVEFLLARYDEREQVARAASPGPWSPDADGCEVIAADGVYVAEGFALSGPQLRATVEHITLNDPAYVLEDLAAKRRIVQSYQWHLDNAGRPFAYERAGEMALVERFVRILAAVFASHPDYDEAWRPSCEGTGVSQDDRREHPSPVRSPHRRSTPLLGWRRRTGCDGRRRGHRPVQLDPHAARRGNPSPPAAFHLTRTS